MTATVTGTYTPDGLISGDFPQITKPVTVTDGQTLVRGELVGKVTATGNVITCAHDASDGSQTPFGVMVEAVTASGSTVAGQAYVFGLFDGSKLTFGGTSDLDDLEVAMRLVNLHTITTTEL